MVGLVLGLIFTTKNGLEANVTHMAAQNISTTSPGSKFRDLQVCQYPIGPKIRPIYGSQNVPNWIHIVVHIRIQIWGHFGPYMGPNMGPFGALDQKSKKAKKFSRLAMEKHAK